MALKLFVNLLTILCVSTQLLSARRSDFQKSLSSMVIIRFQQSTCRGQNLNGTCLTFKECRAQNGMTIGTCALGIGTCCAVVIRMCGAVSSVNNTLFQNPTTLVQGSCQLTIRKMSPNIGQFRLYFVQFDINGPNTMGVCATDNFVVSSPGSANIIPPICGMNTGLHMYVDSPQSSNQIILTFNIGPTPAVAPSARVWQILVSQIPTGAVYAAPPGCLMYSMGPSGFLQTYNWQASAPQNMIPHLLASTDYNFCVRREEGFCSICLDQCVASPNGFNLDSADANSLSDATANMCQMDFLTIPCGAALANIGDACMANRFCGGSLNPTAMMMMQAPVCRYERGGGNSFCTPCSEWISHSAVQA